MLAVGNKDNVSISKSKVSGGHGPNTSCQIRLCRLNFVVMLYHCQTENLTGSHEYIYIKAPFVINENDQSCLYLCQNKCSSNTKESSGDVDFMFTPGF